MQTVDGWNVTQLRQLLEDVNVVYDGRLVVLDTNLRAVRTIDGYRPAESSTTYDVDAAVHRSCRLVFRGNFDPDTEFLQPWQTVTSRTTGASVDVPIGVFVCDRPEEQLWHPTTVEGRDLLSLLDDPVGDVHTVEVGVGYQAALAEVFARRGLSLQVTDGVAKTLPRPRSWEIEDTDLKIVSELAAEWGFVAPWAAPDGTLRTRPLSVLADRGYEWIYDTGATDSAGRPRTMVREGRTRIRPTRPSRMVVQTSASLSWPAVEGDGQRTFGPEPGRTMTVVEKVDAADQESLDAQGAVAWEKARSGGDEVRVDVAVNPLHGHDDVVLLRDIAGLGVDGRWQVARYTLPGVGGGGRRMPLTLREVV